MSKIQFLDLGWQPIANGFLDNKDPEKEYFYSLRVALDAETNLFTQMECVKPDLMFNDNYAYRASMSYTMRKHFEDFSRSMKSYTRLDNGRVLEIGSNDGVFIKNWDPHTTFAVEPCGNFAEETNALGYKTYSDFWNIELAEKILNEQGPIGLIYAANCMCHIQNLDEAFSAVERLLSDEGLFVFEDPSLAEMINNNSYDQIYDEHPHVFSVIALQKILERNGLSIVHVDGLSVHGGSNRIWAKKTRSAVPNKSVQDNIEYEKILGLDEIATFLKFAARVEQSKEDLKFLLTRCANSGKKVVSYGATSKSTTIFNYCDIGPDLIEYIVDTTPEKQNKFSPGVHIPIVSPIDNFDNSVDFALLGAWNFAEEIKKKESEFTGKFITHVPTVRIV